MKKHEGMRRIAAVVLCLCLTLVGVVQAARFSGKTAPVSEIFAQEAIFSGGNFYEWANAALLKEKRAEYGGGRWSFPAELSEKARTDRENVLEKAQSGNFPEGSSLQKIGDLYTQILSSYAGEADLGALRSPLSSLMAAADIPAYLAAVVRIAKGLASFSILGGFSSTEDPENSDVQILVWRSADVLLGKELAADEGRRAVYAEYVGEMLHAFDPTLENTAADAVMRVADVLCDASLSIAENFDMERSCRILSGEAFRALFSAVDEDALFRMQETDLSGAERIRVREEEQARAVNALLSEENLEDLKRYTLFVTLNDYADALGGVFPRLAARCESALRGVEMREETVRAAQSVTDLLGWEFSRYFAKNTGTGADFSAVAALVEEIRQAYKKEIEGQKWLSEKTKARAIKKLDLLRVKIGAPADFSRYCDGVKILPASRGGSYLQNLISYRQAEGRAALSAAFAPTDRERWYMTPETVNAYYSPKNNEIVLPRGILQPPYFDPSALPEENAGGIGSVIAHEISHAFDSYGSLFDEKGNYAPVWSKKEQRAYDRKCRGVVRYYDRFSAFGKKVNGKQTLTENLADLGGLQCVTSLFSDPAALRRLFERYAAVWAEVLPDAYGAFLMETDVHAPNAVRVNATVYSTDAFYYAYGLRPNAAGYVAPRGRVGVWD